MYLLWGKKAKRNSQKLTTAVPSPSLSRMGEREREWKQICLRVQLFGWSFFIAGLFIILRVSNTTPSRATHQLPLSLSQPFLFWYFLSLFIYLSRFASLSLFISFLILIFPSWFVLFCQHWRVGTLDFSPHGLVNIWLNDESVNVSEDTWSLDVWSSSLGR